VSKDLSSFAFYRGWISRADARSYRVDHFASRVRQLSSDVQDTVRNETLVSGCIMHG